MQVVFEHRFLKVKWIGDFSPGGGAKCQSVEESVGGTVVLSNGHKFQNPEKIKTKLHHTIEQHGCFHNAIPSLMDSLMTGEWQKSLVKGIPSSSAAPVAPFKRVKWSDLAVRSDLGKRMLKRLQTCTPVHDCPDAYPQFNYDKHGQPRGKCGGVVQFEMSGNGMGSDLHTWSEALCFAMVTNSSLTELPKWVWTDDSLCQGAAPGSKYTYKDSSFGCYFGNQVDPTCDNSAAPLRKKPLSYGVDARPMYGDCPLYSYNNASQRFAWRVSAVEVLFAQMNPTLPYMASRLIYEMFGPQGAPDDLITIHIRHGDKAAESKLIRIDTFVDAAQGLVVRHKLQNPTIFLLTDNIKAVHLFASAAPTEWTVVYDPTICSKVYNEKWDGTGQAAQVVSQFRGSPGVAQLVSLIIALEAKYFLLTMDSNWSRLLEELRVGLGHCKNGVVDPDAKIDDWRTEHDNCRSHVEYIGGWSNGYR